MVKPAQGELFTTAPANQQVDDPELIGAIERLDIIHHQEGFLPTSRRELNEAFSLLTFIGQPGGTAKHLAEISRHQAKHGADAPRTLRSVTAEYITYRRRSLADRSNLITLREELEDVKDTHRFSQAQGSMHTGLGQLARFMDLTKLAQQKDFASFPFSPLRRYTPTPGPDKYVMTQRDPIVDARIAEVVAPLRKWEAERWVDAAIEDQAKRHDFWSARLQEVAQHQTGQVRAMARQALEGARVLADVE